jgi:hypothetical protein
MPSRSGGISALVELDAAIKTTNTSQANPGSFLYFLAIGSV